MNKPVLITYATRLWSTAEVALRMAELFRLQQIPVEVCNIEDVGPERIDGYGAVIIGSAIRNGAWLPEATEFVKTHEWQLSHIPVAYFTVCMTLHEDTPENRRIVQAYTEPLLRDYNQVQPVALGMFAGKVDYSWMPFVPRVVAHWGNIPEGDWRNWDAIEAWVRELIPLLEAGEPKPIELKPRVLQ